MDRMLYIGMTGAKSMLSKQDRIAQNLANVNTPGYKEIASQTIASHVNNDRLNSRAFAVETTDVVKDVEGPLYQTSTPTDLALNGKGWFSVYDGVSEAYTRNGSFQINSAGMLITAGGLPVLGSGGPISIPPGQGMDVSNDGNVYSVSATGVSTLIDKLKIVDIEANKLVRKENNLFYSNGVEPGEMESVSVHSGYLESSNVNASTQLVDMISASRLFDMQMKTIQIAKENDESANRIIQL